MGLFTLQNNHVVLNPDALAIPPFKEIWEETKDKTTARLYLTYIYFVEDFQSPYNIYSLEEREHKVREQIIKKKNWKEPAIVQKGRAAYREFSMTPSLRSLQTARAALDKVNDYMDNFDHEVDDIAKLHKVISGMGSMIESLGKIEDKVKKEMTENSRIRGGGEVGPYEMPRGGRVQ